MGNSVMTALGNYLLKTRIHAVFTISALTILSVFISPLSYFISGAPMGLVALHRGPLVSLQVACGSLLLIALMAVTLSVQTGIPIAFMVSVWLPVILCASILRRTQSQGLMLLCAGATGSLFNAYIYFMLEDIQGWWQEWFESWKEYATSDQTAQQLEQVYQFISPLLSAFIATGFVISLITTLLLARWWQSALYNPGGFRKEFYSLRLPRVLVFPTLAGLFVLLLAPDNVSILTRDVVILMLILYLYQGLSVIHGFFHTRAFSRVWLTGMYGTFFLLPHVILLFVSCVGIVNACRGKEPEQVTDKNV